MKRDPVTVQLAIDKMAELIELELKKVETLRELRRTFMLGKIAPFIFDKGVRARVKVEGGMTYTSMGDCPSTKTEFIVSQVDGPGEVRVPLFDVPLELWSPETVKALRHLRRATYKTLAGETDVQTAA